MHQIAEVRPSPIAGRWYTADPEQLARQIDHYLSEAVIPPISGKVLGLIAPHAGHRYSGRTAAHAFKTVEGETRDLVIVASPLHGYHPAELLTSAHQFYSTPLGQIAVDHAAIDQLNHSLAQSGAPPLVPLAYDEEHSLEIELPFIQQVLQNSFNLLPIMVRSMDLKLVEILGSCLAELVRDRSSLLVASTDLSHFYQETAAQKFDNVMLKAFESLSPSAVLGAEKHGSGFACGAGAVAAVIAATHELGANHVEILHYTTSADETGDTSSVVGYGAAAILKRE